MPCLESPIDRIQDLGIDQNPEIPQFGIYIVIH
jgi:hypothetical protein